MSEFIYNLPFLMGDSFQVSQGYGGKTSHKDESHYSIDFRMPEGTPICAARSGLVFGVVDHFVGSGRDPSYRARVNTIHILHDDDTIAAYAHLVKNGSRVYPGQLISIGQMIGFSGNTGRTSGPHLHFHVADAFYHKRFPTLFSTERGTVNLEFGENYTRPVIEAIETSEEATASAELTVGRIRNPVRDPHAFAPELLETRTEVIEALAMEGIEQVHYECVDVLHDVHGIEVCGTRPRRRLRILESRLAPNPHP